MRQMSPILLVLATAALQLGCGSRCTPGSTQACACQGGATGVQTCAPDETFATCDCGQLSEAEARRLIEAQDDFTGGVTCGVDVYEYAHGQYGIATSTLEYSACGAALQRAGIVALTGCAQPPSCSYIGFTPSEHAHIDGRFLRFPCGSVALVSVAGITTTGNEATFRYERDVTIDHTVVDAVSDCRLDLAAEGRAERTRTAQRDDAGNWSLVAASR